MYLYIICLPRLKVNLHKNPCLSSSQPNTRSTAPCTLPWPRPRVSALTPFCHFQTFFSLSFLEFSAALEHRWSDDTTWYPPFLQLSLSLLGLPGSSVGQGSTCNAGDTGSIPGSERSPGGGHGNPLQCSCLENPMTEESGGLHSMGWQSWTWLKRLSTNAQSLLKTTPVHWPLYHLAYLPSLPVMIPDDFHSHIKVSGLPAHWLVHCPSPVLLLNHLLPFIFTYNVTLILSLLTLHSAACACPMPYLASILKSIHR